MAEKDNNRKWYRINKFEVFLIGSCIVNTGPFFSWNPGLVAGWGSVSVLTLVLFLAYFMLCCCASELASTLPFSGGNYGLARVTLGFYIGFLVGVLETTEYVASTAFTLQAIVGMLVNSRSEWFDYQKYIYIAFYGTALLFNLVGGYTFWIPVWIIGIYSFAVSFIYCFGNLDMVNFHDTVQNSGPLYAGGFKAVASQVPAVIVWFFGIEATNLFSEDTDNPRTDIPFGQMTLITALLVETIFIFFVSSSFTRTDDDLISSSNPLATGFARVFQCSHFAASLIPIPAMYMTMHSQICCIGKLISSMADSKLLPKFLSYRWSLNGAPVPALLLATGLGYGVCISSYYYPKQLNVAIGSYMMLCGFAVYCTQCFGLIMLRTKFANLPRVFRSPVGIPGAFLAMVIFIFGFITISYYQDDSSIQLFACTIGVATVYYFLFVQRSQSFSEQEKKILFTPHVIMHNDNQARSRGRGQRRSTAGFAAVVEGIFSSFGNMVTYLPQVRPSGNVISSQPVATAGDAGVPASGIGSSVPVPSSAGPGNESDAPKMNEPQEAVPTPGPNIK